MSARSTIVDGAIDAAFFALIGMGAAWIAGRIAVALIAAALEWKGQR